VYNDLNASSIISLSLFLPLFLCIIKTWRNKIYAHAFSHFALLTPALSINWKLQKFYRTWERSSSAKTAKRKALGFPPRFEDLVSNFTRLVTDRKAERLNHDHPMAKNALSKFSYNRSSFRSDIRRLRNPKTFLRSRKCVFGSVGNTIASDTLNQTARYNLPTNLLK